MHLLPFLALLGSLAALEHVAHSRIRVAPASPIDAITHAWWSGTFVPTFRDPRMFAIVSITTAPPHAVALLGQTSTKDAAIMFMNGLPVPSSGSFLGVIGPPGVLVASLVGGAS